MSSFFRSAWMKAAIAGVAIAGASFGALAAAGAATALPPGTIHGCVYLKSNRTLEHVYTDPSKGTTCPSGTFQAVWGVQGPQGPAGPAGPATLSVTAATSVSGRDDSGNHGNWATDAFTRMVTVTRHSAVGVSHCGSGAASCYYYTAALADNGTFVTDSGASSPNAGTPISGTVQGTMTGGSKIEFYAGSADGSWDGAPSASGVPATVTGDSPSTTAWVEQFFPGSAIFTTPSLLNWSWTYNAPATCEQWVDAYNNGDGTGTGAGDITGSNACKS